MKHPKGKYAWSATVGAKGQICLKHDPSGYYGRVFEVRNLAANGVMWDGKSGLIDVAGEHVRQTGAKGIAENALSAAIRIRYGGIDFNPLSPEYAEDEHFLGVQMVRSLVEETVYQSTFGVNSLMILIE